MKSHLSDRLAPDRYNLHTVCKGLILNSNVLTMIELVMYNVEYFSSGAVYEIKKLWYYFYFMNSEIVCNKLQIMR